MTTPVLSPVIFDAPFVNPSSYGLYGAVTWTEETGPSRFLAEGVQIRPWNYGGENSFGVWDADWCVAPGESDEGALKDGVRPDMDPEPFPPVTVWAFDECDLTLASRNEVNARVQQVLRLEEQTAVETALAHRMLDDADVIESADNFYDAVSYLEGELSKTNTVGQIHVAASAACLLGGDVVFRTTAGFNTMLGHRYVFGGGYIDSLGLTLIATSPVFGWRDSVQVRAVATTRENNYAAVAERTVVVGYEKLIAAVQIIGGSA